MNCNFGLFPPLAAEVELRVRGVERKKLLSARALADLDLWLEMRRAAA